MLPYLREALLPCETFEEFCDAAGLLTAVLSDGGSCAAFMASALSEAP